MKKKLLSLFIALCLLVALVPHTLGSASAAGSCGENLSWDLDQETGTLTISGSGDMFDFDPFGEEAAPWSTDYDAVTKVVIGEEVTGIGKYAFANLYKLNDIFIPANIQRISNRAFYGTSIAAYTVAEGNPYFSTDEHGVLFNEDKTVLVSFPLNYAGNYSIPEGVEIIEDYAFHGCNRLRELTVPGSVKDMECAIQYCDALKTVIFSEGITELGYFVLSGCPSLYRIQLPNSLKTIYNYAFSDNDNLVSLILPAGVESIGPMAFSDCDNLEQLTILNPEIAVYDDGLGNTFTLPEMAMIYGYAGSTAQMLAAECGLGFWKIPDAPLSGTCGEELTWSLELGTGTLTIEGRGDMYNYDYTDENSAPWHPWVYFIENIALSEELTSIGDFAFEHCHYVSELAIPESVIRIGTNALTVFVNLHKVNVAEGNPAFTNDDYGALYTKDMKELILLPCRYEGTYYVPHGVETIAPNAIANCEALTGLNLPATLRSSSHGIYANGLTQVEFAHGTTNIDIYAVTHCSSLQKILLPDTLFSIDAFAFYDNQSLTEVEIPEHVAYIYKGAFASCFDLERIIIRNPDCVIYSEEDAETTLGVPGTTVIYGYEGSTAMAYAEKYGYGFIPLTDAPSVDESLVIRHTLNLGSNIAINYVVSAAQLEGYDSYHLVCELPVYEGNDRIGTKIVTVKPDMRDGLCYFVLNELNALQMMNEVTAYLALTKDGVDYVSTKDIYSIAAYAFSQLGKPTNSDALKTVCAELLRYGTVAQAWRGYRTDTLACDYLSDEELSYISDLESVEFGQNDRVIPSIENPTVTFAGKSLILDSNIIARFVLDTTAFEGDPSELSVHVRYTDIYGKKCYIIHTAGYLDPYDVSRNLYALDVSTLRATELRSPLLVQVYHNDEAVSQTLEYSVDTYGNGKTGVLLDLMRAIMAYSDSAKAFFSPKPSV